MLLPFRDQVSTQLANGVDEFGDPVPLASGNIIQAVSRTGLSVPPSIEAQDIDISGSLTELDPSIGDTTNIAADPCSAVASGNASSLVNYSKGALPVRTINTTELTAPDSSAQVWLEEVPSSYYANAYGEAIGCRTSSGK